MKKIALLLSMVLVVSLSLSAQNRSSKKSQDRKEDIKKERREIKSDSRSTKSSKATKRGNSKYTSIKSNKSDRNRSEARSTRAKSDNKKANTVRSSVRSSERGNSSSRVNSSDRNRVESPKSNRTYKRIEAPSSRKVNRHSERSERANIRSPKSYSRGIHHGHIANHMHPSYGYNRHEIVIFPRRVNYHFWPNHHVMLYSSYVPEYEYPWAIYEAEDRMACIEGVVVDFDWDRRSQQYILHFGRHAPFQSASVIIPRHLSKYLSRKMIRKLKRDYVSVCGAFNDYGNTPTVKVHDLDQVYVNEIPLKEFLMYY